ncbi:putative ABC transport system ATP-binding protein [Agrobacterium larrymoorei]|uniref:ABC transport system ATP-binding protein n=1 Tax=Agrobacterium larrymoorei TaxID=160699 RepID=A0AAJ2B6R7_9HYPH|nr:ABC transporter ATP-binding protein [Agrobacterium larrymoorei]MDR6101368.1 putative ABC transport system ATP-binding protein [Agrobacterium larrymoorei]
MLITLSNVSKSYQTAEGPITVLRGIDLSVDVAQSVALTGESGSGKSTLLHLAGGLDRADAGSIIVNGEDITALDEAGRAGYRRKTVGLVFQQFNLIPSLSVVDNIAFHAKLAGRYDSVWAGELAETLGLDALLKRYPEQLSGGQQQRVAIARTLAARPALVLADEPTGNLDETTSEVVLDLMISLSRSAGSALLLVTHSSRMASKLDRQVVLRGGKIVA